MKIHGTGTSLVVQWVRLHAPKAGGLGSTPGRGTRSHVHATTKSPHAATNRSSMPKRKSHTAKISKINVFKKEWKYMGQKEDCPIEWIDLIKKQDLFLHFSCHPLSFLPTTKYLINICQSLISTTLQKQPLVPDPRGEKSIVILAPGYSYRNIGKEFS